MPPVDLTDPDVHALNLAAVLKRQDEISFEPVHEPDAEDLWARPGDCIVEVQRVGICGSDVHYWKHGKIGGFILEGPMILGHESSGVVKAVGEKVTHLEVGDRVAMEPGIPCDACEHCSANQYNLCKDIRFFATPPVNGSLRKRLCHPAK